MFFPPLDKRLASYQRRLDESLLPKEDVGDFRTITDTSDSRDGLITFLKEQAISSRLYDHHLNEFDNQLSTKKSTYGDRYTNGSYSPCDAHLSQLSR